jgi:hypothetical protein
MDGVDGKNGKVWSGIVGEIEMVGSSSSANPQHVTSYSHIGSPDGIVLKLNLIDGRIDIR